MSRTGRPDVVRGAEDLLFAEPEPQPELEPVRVALWCTRCEAVMLGPQTDQG